uniref:Enkurin domain-containing protein 1 n=1 Tax=Bactrocera dorsalis TaxID=27457 RepID=A0A034WHI7_BACDO
MSNGGVVESRSKSAISATSVKPMETLKGIFSVPKMDRNRRNFLRENKLSLRELQRVTNKSKIQQQQEQLLRDQKYAGRRSQSQQRNNNNCLDKQTVARCPSLSRVPSGRVMGTSAAGGVGDCSNHISRRSVSRTNSTTTIKSVHKQVQTEDIQDEQFLYDALKRCTTNESQSRFNGLQPNFTPRSQHIANDAQSRNSFYPSADEDQRCLGNTDDRRFATQPQIEDPYVQREDPNNYVEQYNAQQHGEVIDGDDVDTIHNENVERLYAPESSSKYNFAPTPRSQQHFTNGYNMVDSDGLPPTTTMQSSYEPPDQQQQQQPLRYRMQPHVQGDLRANFENMSLNNGYGGVGVCDVAVDEEYGALGNSGGVEAVSISGRSRRTNISHNSQQSNTDLVKKRSSGSIHKLGSRDNISLPRYLEREKREKEEQRQRQSERDPNCPPGHYPLSDKERQAALQSAETRFKALVNELNRMPMTTETLRMRVRKAEIEKELKLLETDIRVFSKSKVYLKHKEQNI